jgi:hypothetical protein
VNGSTPLAEEARHLMSVTSGTVDEMLLEYWHNPTDRQFFAKAFLQPYLRWLTESGSQPLDKAFESTERRCPFCGGMPQVRFLQIRDPTSESGNEILSVQPAQLTGRSDASRALIVVRSDQQIRVIFTLPNKITSELKRVIPASITSKV